MIELSIVIVNYNTANQTLACLQSIVNQAMNVSYELIVVDNASTDLSAILIKSKLPEIIWIQNPTNLGFGSAVNTGVAHAQGAFVAVINSDVVVLGNALEHMLVRFRTDSERVGMVNCSLVDDYGVHQKVIYHYNAAFKEVLSYNRMLVFLFKSWFQRIPSEIKALNGACLLVKRSLFLAVHGFDPDYFLYSEEFDLSRRILAQGFGLTCYDDIKVFHENEGSSLDKSWNLRQRSASIAMLFRKTHGVPGLLFYYWLIGFNWVSNGLFLARMNQAERNDYRLSARVHLANLLVYFRILFRLKSTVPTKVK
ncbi:MAG: glycosyltransferase family 2 protein [Flavobacteriales bacterium]